MPKTLSKADKDALKKAKQDEQAALRAIEKAQRDAALKAQVQPAESEEKPANVDKKAAKADAKRRAKERLAETPLGMPKLQASAASTVDSLAFDIANTLTIAAADAKEEFNSRQTITARVVHNHSTHCEGLEPILKALKLKLPAATIIPGVLKQLPGNVENFVLDFDKTDGNSYHFVARNGHASQQLSIVVNSAKLFNEVRVRAIVTEVISDSAKRVVQTPSSSSADDISFGVYNRAVATNSATLWKENERKNHEALKEKERAAKAAADVGREAARLKNKGLTRDQIAAHAERNAKIVNGEERTRNSMRKH